jgi:hypothetical protein
MLRRTSCWIYLVATVAWSTHAHATDFEHVWSCKLLPGQGLGEARAAAADWLIAARSMQGGNDISVNLRWPIAVAESEERFEFVLRMPSLESWGRFYDRYDPGSLVGKADEAFARVASCSGSTLWEVIIAAGGSAN